MCVTEHNWLPPAEFEDAIATVNLLPGPASTQLAIFCAWRLRGTLGAIVGGACFIVPGLVLILALSALFLAHRPPDWVLGAAAGAGAAVPAVALKAASGLVPASWARMGGRKPQRLRWSAYALAGGVAAVAIGPYLVLVLVACGLVEMGPAGTAFVGDRGRPASCSAPSPPTPLPLEASAPWPGWPSRSALCLMAEAL